ncbi:hypothetical protein M2347_002493 [Chryseobacterium sp. H1D6B]|uniref:type VI secretion system TssO n=1 Tax=Chryseobacterium sp. H1D6B TaxID=2940588 RepID=UPI0015C9012B|nr:type VI secretion system TssO [Chryseobacterium sp. H1D6B]MDH6252766.1 hypothetical protein [Chryseobacterium sp. H1D6B]
MSSNREKKLNTSDVRMGIWKFALSFIVLSAVSFCAVFFFFKSYDIQRKGIQKEADNYKEMLLRSDLLRIQVDSIYYRMSQLDVRKVDNDIILRNYIIDNVRDARNIMGPDSATNFKHYSTLLKNVVPIINLKNEIIAVDGRKQIAIRNLNECMGKDMNLKRELKVDPTRKFTGSRRGR